MMVEKLIKITRFRMFINIEDSTFIISAQININVILEKPV
jgi:hypothetical protein